MKNTTVSAKDGPRFKRTRTKLFNVCKAIDYTMSFNQDGTFTIYDVSGNFLGRLTADEWLNAIKTTIRSVGR